MTASSNLDLLRSIYAGWERGDFSSVEWAHPEIDCVFVGGPDPRGWRGHAGMAEGMRAWLSAWRDFRTEPSEYREPDHERVLVLTTSRARGKSSGLEIERQAAANLFCLRDGKVVRLSSTSTATAPSPTSASGSRRCRTRT